MIPNWGLQIKQVFKNQLTINNNFTENTVVASLKETPTKDNFYVFLPSNFWVWKII